MAATARKPATAAKPKPKASLAARVDRLGELLALIEPLAAEAADLKEAFKALGIGTYMGVHHYCTVTDRNLPDGINRAVLFENFDRAALIGLGVVTPGGTTLAASCRPRPDAGEEEKAAA